MYRGCLLLLTAAVALTACNDGNDDGLDAYDDQPRVTYAPSRQFDAQFEIVRHDARVREDATPDAAMADAATPDAAIPDAAAADAAPDTGPPGRCQRPADCALAVRLRTCDVCPVAAAFNEVREDPCVEEWFPGATLFSYGREECFQGCEGGATPCIDPPNGVDCVDGRCVVVR